MFLRRFLSLGQPLETMALTPGFWLRHLAKKFPLVEVHVRTKRVVQFVADQQYLGYILGHSRLAKCEQRYKSG